MNTILSRFGGIITGRGFETEDVLDDMKEHQPDAMIVRITCGRGRFV